MTRTALLLLVPFVGAFSGTCVIADTRPTVEQLHWLSGCWASDGAEKGSGERWTSPAGGAMFGIARTIRGGRLSGFEYLRIVETDEDSLVLIASPSGQATAEFTLRRLDDSEVVFENPDHDFPQRIVYRLIDSNHLLGRVEGRAEGNDVRIDFPMTRISCQEE